MEILKTQRLIIEEFSANVIAFIIDLVNEDKWLRFVGNRQMASEADALR